MFNVKDLVLTPASKLKVGDLIFGSGGLGEARTSDPHVERAVDEYGVDFNLLLRFYRVIKVNPSSFWVLDIKDRKKYKLANWFWDGSGELKVKKVPEKYKKEVESKLVETTLEYQLEKKNVRPIARIHISFRRSCDNRA